METYGDEIKHLQRVVFANPQFSRKVKGGRGSGPPAQVAFFNKAEIRRLLAGKADKSTESTSTSTSDTAINQLLQTLGNSTFWKRAGTVLSPKTAGDSLTAQSISMVGDVESQSGDFTSSSNIAITPNNGTVGGTRLKAVGFVGSLGLYAELVGTATLKDLVVGRGTYSAGAIRHNTDNTIDINAITYFAGTINAEAGANIDVFFRAKGQDSHFGEDATGLTTIRQYSYSGNEEFRVTANSGSCELSCPSGGIIFVKERLQCSDKLTVIGKSTLGEIYSNNITITFDNLPTTNPGGSGRLWKNGTTVDVT